MINIKIVVDILAMVDYFIQTNREIQYVNVSDTWYYWLVDYINNNKSKFVIISKTANTILVERNAVNVLFKNDKWISDPGHKVEMTKIETIGDIYYIKDFYIKLK